MAALADPVLYPKSAKPLPSWMQTKNRRSHRGDPARALVALLRNHWLANQTPTENAL